MQQNALQLVGRIIEDDLLEGVIRLGQLLGIVQTDAEIEQIAAGQTFPLIPAVDILRAMNNVADCIARQGNGAHATGLCLHILDNHRLSRFLVFL